MLVNLKQANPVLLALITAGLILVAWRDPALRTRRALLQLPRMLGPGIVVLALWRWYVMHNLSNAEQDFRPLEARYFSNPPGIAWQRFLRAAAADMRYVIPRGSKVVIVSFSFPNSLPFGVAVRYYLWQLDLPEQRIVTTIRWNDRDLATVTSLAARGQVDYLIIQDADGSMDMATDTLGLPRLNHELVLFVWRDDTWEQVKSWPIPPALITASDSVVR
jgi:hypothetical protein